MPWHDCCDFRLQVKRAIKFSCLWGGVGGTISLHRILYSFDWRQDKLTHFVENHFTFFFVTSHRSSTMECISSLKIARKLCQFAQTMTLPVLSQSQRSDFRSHKISKKNNPPCFLKEGKIVIEKLKKKKRVWIKLYTIYASQITDVN